jgi:hypothetical protein
VARPYSSSFELVGVGCWREVNSNFDLNQLINKIVRPWFLYETELQSSLANQLN